MKKAKGLLTMNYHVKKAIGQKFGMLTIVSHHSRSRGYNCKCECGGMTISTLYKLKTGRRRSCGCREFYGKENKNYRGYDDLTETQWWVIKYRAKRRHMEMNITREYAWELFVKQEKKCKFTGWPLKFGSYHYRAETTASLDRIDSSKGYVEGNVQWVHKDINKMKLNKSDAEFIKMCHAISQHCPINNSVPVTNIASS